jgi:hypothetical protein
VIVSIQSSPLRALVVSALLCVGLGAAMVFELSSAGDADAPALGTAAASPSPAAAIPKTPARFTLPPLESFAEVTQRPLFSSSRRPAAIDTPQSAEQPFSAKLAGIVISTQSSSIIVSHGDPPVLARLKEGDDLDGWLVTSIEPTLVLLQRDGVEQQLRLRDTPGTAVAVTPVAATTMAATPMAATPKPEPAPRPRH